MNFDNIEKLLARLEPKQIADGNLVRAAVLVPMFVKDGRIHLLMLKRTADVGHHKNQIAFPGGVCEPGDNGPVATALREAEEETGLEPGRVRVLGIFHDTATITGFRITPVVGAIPHPYPFRPNPAEVARLLEVPFDLFGDESKRTSNEAEVGGRSFRVDFHPFEGDTIWGASARIAGELYRFLRRKGGSR